MQTTLITAIKSHLEENGILATYIPTMDRLNLHYSKWINNLVLSTYGILHNSTTQLVTLNKSRPPLIGPRDKFIEVPDIHINASDPQLLDKITAWANRVTGTE